MHLLSHLNAADRPLLHDVDERFPFPFLREYAAFFRDYHRQDLFLLYSPAFEAWMPLRIIRTKLATLGQVFFAPFGRSGELVPKDQLIFFNMMLRYIRRTGLCDRLIQPYPFVVLGALPPFVRSCEFGTYIIDLQRSMDDIFESFAPKYKKAVRHAIRHEARVDVSWNAFDDFYEAYRQTMERVHMPAEPETYFRALHRHLGDRHALPAVVYDGDRPVGSAFYVYTRYAAFCTHAGSLSGSSIYGAMKLLHYRVIGHMKKQGVSRYDLVGVRLRNTDPALEGVFRFKKGFGGDLRSGYLWKTDIHPLRMNLYDSVLALRQFRRRHKDIIDQSN